MPSYVTRHDLDEMAFGEEIPGEARTLEAAKALLVREVRDQAGHRWDGEL